MAGELVTFGIQKLWDLLSQEYERFQGLEDQVNELKRKLELLSSLMKDADAKKHTSKLLRKVVEQTKDIIYDAEDIVETLILKDKLRKRSGINNLITRLACSIPDHRRDAVDIEGILTRISNVIQDMQGFGVQITNDGYMQPLRDIQREMRQTFPTNYESDFVGLEENVKKLVEYVVEKVDVQVVTITGMGGLGKTTLARQVFNHKDVKKWFNGFAWVSVSQDFTVKNVWQKILVDHITREEEKKILEMPESTLQAELFQLLETSKSLIVLDDVWKKEDWDRIKLIFPPKKGWKLLLTSRKESVVVDRTYINLKLKCLTIEDSWKLLQRIAIPRNDASEYKVDVEMEKMGKEMIKHCGGLPLAINVLGGLLAENYTRHDWKRLSENIGSHLVGGSTNFNDENTNPINHVLSLSFEELPSYLKYCFLYLAHLPKDHIIDIEKLSYYWAAEGVIEYRNYDGHAIRDVGDSYVKELVRRNMIISGRDVTTLRFETCHLHDMMREICLFKAKEENFLQITGHHPPTANSQSPCRSRRLIYQNPNTLHIERDVKNPKLRSLVVLPVNDYGISISSFTRLELLRVLDLFKAKLIGRKLPSGIGKLIHLRYLSLETTEISHLHSSLRNLVLLIYLNIDVASEVSIFVPNVLKRLPNLRYVVLPRVMHRSTKLELSNLVNLEALKNFSTANCRLKDLRDMVRLRTLDISVTGDITMKAVYESISGMRHLENLAINGSERMLEENVAWNFVDLRRLSLSISLPKLPTAQHFPYHLTILELTGSGLKEDPMPILERLPNLKEVVIWPQSFCGRVMVCSHSGFPQLQKLSLFGLEKLKEWSIEQGSMPLLHTLTISNCPKLKQLPYGLRFITSLKELAIHTEDLDMKKEWKKRLSEGGEDYYKVQHIPSIKF